MISSSSFFLQSSVSFRRLHQIMPGRSVHHQLCPIFHTHSNPISFRTSSRNLFLGRSLDLFPIGLHSKILLTILYSSILCTRKWPQLSSSIHTEGQTEGQTWRSQKLPFAILRRRLKRDVQGIVTDFSLITAPTQSIRSPFMITNISLLISDRRKDVLNWRLYQSRMCWKFTKDRLQ
jgi:hypothetical protein